MKKLFVFLLFTLNFSLFTYVKAQSWDWGYQPTGGASGDGGYLAVDNQNNGYWCGFISGRNMVYGSYTLTCVPGTYNAALIKYDTSGHVIWAKQSIVPTVTSSCGGSAVTVDKNGNVYETGAFVDTAHFGLYTLIANTPYNNVFLIKYDKNGNIVWVKQATGPSSSSGGYTSAITIDGQGNIYISGQFHDTVNFGGHTLISPNWDYFLVKYDTGGNTLWAIQATNAKRNGGSIGMALAYDPQGYIYADGYFNDSAAFGATLLKAKGYALMLLKYDTAGNLIWARQSVINTPGFTDGYAFSVAVGNGGYVYITGLFNDSLYLPPYKLSTNALYGNSDVFIAKYQSNGNIVWAKAATVLDSNRWTGYVINTDTLNNFYLSISGMYYPGYHIYYKIAFGTDTLKTTNSSVDGSSAIIKFDSAGNVLCGSIIPAGGDDIAGTANNNAGSIIYFGGDLANKVNLGSGLLTETDEGPFMARWKPCNSDIETGISSTEPKNDIIIFPNPATGIFTIHFVGAQNFEPKNIEIYNVLGERVLNETLRYAQGDKVMDLSEQPNGIYFYRVLSESGGMIGEGKVIIEK